MSKSNKRYLIDTIIAESWDGKRSAPNVRTLSETKDSLEIAKAYVQETVAIIAGNHKYKLEWINWTTQQVEIKFNYQNSGAGKVRQTYIMKIIEVDENGIRLVDIGD